MRSRAARSAWAIAVLCILSAVPAAVSPRWGWVATLAVATSGATALALYIRNGLERPLSDLISAADVRPAGSLAETADLLAAAHRELLDELAAARAADRDRDVALAHATDGVLLLDVDGTIRFANPAAHELFGARALEVARRLTQPDLGALVRRAVASGRVGSQELTVRLPEARHVIARAVPLTDGGAVLLVQDRSEADRLDRVRRDFVANVSHELKTPVAAMRALADVASSAMSDGDAGTATRFIDRLQVEAERLGGLVSNLLDLSRVETGGELQVEQVELRAVADAAADRARSIAELKGVALEVRGDATVVDGDPSQIAMAVQNLVENAVRYSDRGTVRLSVEASDGWASIAVSDEGIGIPAEELPRIFERFYRVDRARSRATGGTGLGLAIVRHVAENHGGRVEVQSELGLGSTFRLHLPTRAPERSGHAA
ncbi:MAG TPA: ATP-binding protein [Actinomycetota bacterium]|nr:ATP-binding protein [Actinomycetota bacterium]